MKKILIGVLSFIVILGLAGVCGAEDAVAPKVTVGGDVRVRGEITKNNTDLNDDFADNTQVFRHRTRLWVNAEVEGGYTAYVRLAAEPRWGRPDFGGYNDNYVLESARGEWQNHVIIDNSYIEAKDFMGTPITLKIGRQDMMYGEGFLIADGTDITSVGNIAGLGNNDGSRTAYFDAIKLSSLFGDTSADLFLGKVNENLYNTPDDEDFYGLYITNKSVKNHTFEGCALHRAQKITILKNNTTAIGIRSTGTIVENLTYGVELAKQFGKFDSEGLDMDRDALGGLAHLTYAMPAINMQPRFKIGAYYMSGDDATTNDKNEAWDNFYSEWPKYGYADLLTTLRNCDPDFGTWTNMMIYEAEISATLLPDMTAKLGYLLLAANEQNGAASKTRGGLPEAYLGYKFNKSVSGYLAAQYFQPGDYYATDDDVFFGRAEFMIKF